MDAACIFLNDGIADAGIQPGSSLESIVQQLILLVTNPGCVDAPGGVPGGGTVTFINAIWPGNAITIAGGPISNSGTFVFNGNGTSNQYIDGQGNLQNFPPIPAPIEFQTNGTPNSVQNLLNLVAGTGVTLTESGGSVTIDVDANVYTVNNGLSPDPTDANNFQLGSETPPGAPLIHDTYIAGAQFRFEINNTNSMFLQGNRVDIEGAAAGAMMLSTGGASDNSVEVDGVEVAIESTASSNTTKIFLDPLKIRIQTPLYNIKNNGDVLTLIDSATGEVEYMPVVGILLQTDGSDNADQALLNLVSGNGITLTNTGGDVVIDGPLFQTNGTDNSVQTLLNLVAGTGITLTESAGSVTIDAAAPAINLTTNDFGGPATYDPVTGDLNIPIYQTQLDIQDEGSTVAINPDFLNFIGDAVTVTQSGTGADITITGGTPYVVENGLHAFGGVPGETPPDPFLFHLGGNLVENTEINLDTAYDLDVLADTGKKMLHLEFGVARIGDIDDASSTGLNTYADIGQSFKVRYSGVDRGLDIDKGAGYWAMGDLDNTNLGSKIEIKDLGQAIEILGKVASTYNRRGFYLTYGGSINLSLGDIDNSLNGTAYTLDDLSELHTFTKRLKLSNYNNSTAYQSWTEPAPGTAGAPVGVLNVDNQGNVFVGSGTALAIEVDGTPLSSSTLLNFIPSTDIAVTDAGGGSVQFTLVNPPVTYDSDNGVYNNSDIFQLGVDDPLITAADFQTTRYINANTHSLNIKGPGNTVANGVLNVSDGDYAIQGTGNIRGVSGIALAATGSSYGGYFSGFTTIYGVCIDNGGRGVQIALSGGLAMNTSQMFLGNGISYDNADQIYNAIRVARSIQGTVPLQNFGISYEFALSVNSGGLGSVPVVSNKFVSKLYDPIEASAKTQFEIQGLTNGAVSLTPQFTILGGGASGAWSLSAGQIRFNQYAAGAIYKSADDLVAASGFNLGIDANGNIWATDFSTSTGPVTGVSNISIGTLTNGATATVSNPSGPAATINITGQNAYTQIAADSGTASADTFNSQFSVIGADGITTSVANGTMPASDVITVTGPDKYLNFVTKNISGGTIATYTPTIWNETLNIQAGTGITITNGGSANTIVISGGAGTGTVSNVTGVNGNGFTVGVTNGTTTPAITVGTSITGVLVGNGTSVSAVTGTGVMVFTGTGYTFQALPTVNDGAIAIGSNIIGLTNTSVALANSLGGAFTANKATSSTYRLEIGPALANLVTLMTAAMPVNPAVSAGATTVLPPYIVKTGQDTYTIQTPVTTFSPGSTGFTVTSLVSSATTGPLNGAVVLGGSLNVTSGGTGLTTAPGEGQILIGNSTGGFNIGNVSAGTGISVSSSGTGIQISATGITPSVLNGLHIHTGDGSIRLGSGTPADGDVIRPLIERTDIRMNNQIYRLSNLNQGYISDVGFQIDDATGQKIGYLGSSTSTSVTAANPPQVGFVFSGAGGTALATHSGFYIDNTVSGETKVYAGFSSSIRQVIARSATLANNKLTQVGTWGTPGTADSTFYEAIPSARTIQIGANAGNNNWIKLDDANQRVDFNKSTIYASAYGGGLVTSGTGLTYLIGTDVGGKFFEFAGRSISQITSQSGTFSASSMASATAPVPFSIVGAGSISTSIAGNVLTITNAATAFPYWSGISTAVTVGSTGTVTGPSPISPQVIGANNLQFNAGSGIAIRTVAAGVGSATGSLIEITNNGVLSLATGALNTFSVAAVVGSPGSFNLNIPFQWRTVNLTNTGVVPVGSTTATSALTPNIALSDITLNGGPGVTINTNTSTRVVTISAASGSSLPSTNGVWQHPNSVTPTEYRLGSDTDGPSIFTQDRWINAQSSFLQIKGTPATGDGNGILKLLSTGAGRGLRVENSNASPNGAIYATSAQLTSTDAAPTGAIYGNSSGAGSAIVGDGSDLATGNTRPAIFGKGYIAVKGYTTTAGGVGVYGQSETGLGIGVQGRAVGGATTSYAGLFAITNGTTAKQEVVKIAKEGGVAIGSGTLVGYYLGATKKGQIGYVSTDAVAGISSSQYEATVVSGAVETVRHRIESSGQQTFSAYVDSTSFPLPIFAGNQYKGITLTANTGSTGVDVGKVFTTRVEYGDYNAGVSVTSAPAGTLTSNQSTYSLNGKFVTVQVSGTITYTAAQGVGTRTLTFFLPSGVNYVSSSNALFSWNTFRSMTYFSKASIAVASTSVSVTLTIDTPMPANFVNEFYINLTYLTA
jgi:hypothetical protein